MLVFSVIRYCVDSLVDLEDEIELSSWGMSEGFGILYGILNEIAPSFFKALQ